MELRQIFAIVLRRWWLVLLPPLAVAAISLRDWRTLLDPPVSYSTAVRFTVGQPPADEATGFDPRYYSWLSSEYVANGLEEWARGRGFAEHVSADVAARHGLSIAPERIQGSVAADSARSVMVLYLSWPDGGELAKLADSAVHVVRENNAEAFPQLGPGGAVATPLDAIHVATVAPGLRERLDLPLRLALALAAGLGLAFAADYLDPTLRTRTEVESLGLRLVGEIPRGRRGLRPRR